MLIENFKKWWPYAVFGAIFCIVYACLLRSGYALRLHPLVNRTTPLLLGAGTGVFFYIVLFFTVKIVLLRGTVTFIAVLLLFSVLIYPVLLPEADVSRQMDTAFRRTGPQGDHGPPFQKRSLNHESRRCVAAEFGKSLQLPFEGNGRLYFGVGLPRIPNAEGDFVLRAFYVHDSGRRQKLLEQKYELTKSAWYDVDVDISSSFSKGSLSVRGEFSDPDDKVRVPSSYRFYLTEPHLISPDKETNVILVLVDTLRADRTGTLSGRKDITPQLDDAASGGLVFTSAFSQSSFTPPSVASMFTGRMPHQLGIREQNYLPEKAITIAERFREHGYVTGAVSSNLIISPDSNFDQGFDSFRFHPQPLLSYYWNSAERVTNEAIDWLGLNEGRPSFLYLHYSDPHIPYLAPWGNMVDHSTLESGDYFSIPSAEVSLAAYLNAPLIGRWKESFAMQRSYRKVYESLYNAEVKYWDEQFGRIIHYLSESGCGEDTLVIVTSDHGEEFLEHDYYLHGFTLYNEVIHVPLFMWGPDVPEKRLDRVVQVADIFSTLEDMLGWTATPKVADRSLKKLWNGGTWEDRAFAHLFPLSSSKAISLSLPPYYDDKPLSFFSMIHNDWKLIEYRYGDPGKRSYELFNLADDFSEQNDMSRSAPERLNHSRELLHDYLDGLPGPVPPEERKISPELLETIKSLGYLQE